MKLETAKSDDATTFVEWVCAKMNAGYEVSVDELHVGKDGAMLKVEGCFFCPARFTLFEGRPAVSLGPLIPRPGLDGKVLVIALRRMIRRIQLEFNGDIVYPNVSDNGVDEAARRIGGFEDVVTANGVIMRLRGTYV